MHIALHDDSNIAVVLLNLPGLRLGPHTGEGQDAEQGQTREQNKKAGFLHGCLHCTSRTCE